MKILMVTPEMFPYAKVGGLADVVGTLPKHLAKNGHDVRVCLPLYGNIQKQNHWKIHENIPVRLGGHERICRIWEAEELSHCTFYFIEYNHYYERHEIYAGPWGSHFDNGERFAFLNRASLDLCYALKWLPDVIHCHDWTTGLVPVYLNTTDYNQPLGQAASVFTVHNLEHQGIFDKNVLGYAGIPFSEFRPDSMESMGCLNWMKSGLYHATKITTVSPTYAQEIQSPEFGCGLNHVLRFKAADLLGILNGIDSDTWNPESDSFLPARFNAEDLSGKNICKQVLQKRFGLKTDPHIPIFAVISRLYAQKGLDVLLDILPSVLQTMEVQFILLGAGEKALEEGFSSLAEQKNGQLGVFIGYNAELSHLIEAGSDFFVMPSRFEPCGLNQLYSMRYGTLPIVRKTGGLADTVDPYNENDASGTGFVFEHLTPSSLYNTIGWACSTYYDRTDDFKKLQYNAMKKDFSWEISVKKYEEVYEWAIKKRLSRSFV